MRVLRNLVMPLVLLLLSSAAVLAKDKAPIDKEPVKSELLLQVEGGIVIDPQGSVVTFSPADEQLPELRAALDRIVLGWRFHPVKIGGVAMRVQTKVRIVLAADKQGEKYQVRIDNVIFPQGTGNEVMPDGASPRITGLKLKPPTFPRDLNRAGVTGVVLLGIRVGENGEAADIVAVQSMLYDVRGNDRVLRQAIEVLERSATRQAKQWTFTVPKHDSPMSASERTVMVPVEYIIDKAPAATKWRTVVRLPKREIHWLPKDSEQMQVGVADANAGEVISGQSALTLITDAAGTVVM